YEDLNDQLHLRNDPLWQALAEYSPDPEQPLASPPTLCRLENPAPPPAPFGMSRAPAQQVIPSLGPPPQCPGLDLDCTDGPVHGRQEGRFFHGYYDHYCFLPLYVFCGEQLLVAYLRTADGDAARHSGAVLKLLVTRLRQAWPSVRIIVRGDSGFCRWRLMRWCESNGLGYVLGVARNSRLEALACPWTNAAAVCFELTGEAQRLFGEFAYAAQSWDRSRRVIVKAGHNEQGANPRFVVSNLPGNARGLY